MDGAPTPNASSRLRRRRRGVVAALVLTVVAMVLDGAVGFSPYRPIYMYIAALIGGGFWLYVTQRQLSRQAFNLSDSVSATTPDPHVEGADSDSGWPVGPAPSTTWTVVGILGGMLLGGASVATLAVVGVTNAHLVTVIEQEASPATYVVVPTGEYDVVRIPWARVCGPDEVACLNRIRSMHDDTCLDKVLLPEGAAICTEWSDLLALAQREHDRDGQFSPTTAWQTQDLGTIRAVPLTTSVLQHEARPQASRTEMCKFSLGPVQVGTCAEPPKD